MKKHNNDNAVSPMSVILAVTAYLFVASLLLSFFLVEFYGADIITPELPSQNDVTTYSSTQNFKEGSYNLSTIGSDINSKWVFIDGVGAILTQLGTHTYSYFGINNIQKDSLGLYQNTYWINNTAENMLSRHGDYCIILRFTGGLDQNEVCVKSDGFHIPVYLISSDIVIGDKYFYAYPDANQIENPSIKTIYNDNEPSVIFYFEGEKLFETTELNEDVNIFGLAGRYFGGAGSYTLGFTLEEFQTSNSIISGLNSANGQDILGMLGALIITMLKIATFTLPAEFLPTEIAVILIGLPEGLLILCIAVVFIRGVD